jgi:hypothetical protein
LKEGGTVVREEYKVGRKAETVGGVEGNIKFEGRRKQLEKSKYKVEGGNSWRRENMKLGEGRRDSW